MTTETVSTVNSPDRLAERLYEAWRERQDFVEPLTDKWRYDGSLRARPAWRMLTTVQQDVWRHVAEMTGLP